MFPFRLEQGFEAALLPLNFDSEMIHQHAKVVHAPERILFALSIGRDEERKSKATILEGLVGVRLKSSFDFLTAYRSDNFLREGFTKGCLECRRDRRHVTDRLALDPERFVERLEPVDQLLRMFAFYVAKCPHGDDRELWKWGRHRGTHWHVEILLPTFALSASVCVFVLDGDWRLVTSGLHDAAEEHWHKFDIALLQFW